jgi:hypothetical protein
MGQFWLTRRRQAGSVSLRTYDYVKSKTGCVR